MQARFYQLVDGQVFAQPQEMLVLCHHLLYYVPYKGHCLQARHRMTKRAEVVHIVLRICYGSLKKV